MGDKVKSDDNYSVKAATIGFGENMSGHDIFLSHSEQDEKLIAQIANSLKRIDLDVYIEEYETNYGGQVVESVCEAIDGSDYILVVLTDESVKSQWVNQEIGYAYAREKEIIPVRVGKVKVAGMIGGIKGIKAKSDVEEEIISKILDFFVEKFDSKIFSIECERCGEKERWDFPTKKDKFNWHRKDKPMICDCSECNYKNKINPFTLLSVQP